MSVNRQLQCQQQGAKLYGLYISEAFPASEVKHISSIQTVTNQTRFLEQQSEIRHWDILTGCGLLPSSLEPAWSFTSQNYKSELTSTIKMH
jgi:hypothetical protein